MSASLLSLKLRVCMECGETATLASGRDIYPHRRDLYDKRFWKCVCGAYVGCHGGGMTPLGYPAGPETRKARAAAHAAFDPMWKSKRRSRSAAYKWLALQLGQAPHETHISWMDAETARRVVEICREADGAALSNTDGGEG